MGTYYIPRNYKGETRILYIFTIKSLITTMIGGIIGAVFLLIFSLVNLKIVGIVITAVFALIGFIVGALKIPTLVAFPITKKIGGEPIGEIVMRYVKYKQTKRIYLYIDSKEEQKKKMEKEKDANG